MQKHNQNTEKLDNNIKESLQNYEVPFDSTHWDEMEKMLDSAPRNYTAFKGWSYGLNAILALALLSGSYFIYGYYTNSQPKQSLQQVEQKSKALEISAPPVAVTKKTVPTPIETIVSADNSLPVITTEVNYSLNERTSSTDNKNNVAPGVLNSKEKQELKKPENNNIKSVQESTSGDISAELGFDFSKIDHGLSLNKVPAFGDQIDPKTGFTRSTREDESTKKLAQEKVGTNLIGFLPSQLNKDSLDENKSVSDTTKKAITTEPTVIPDGKKGKDRKSKSKKSQAQP